MWQDYDRYDNEDELDIEDLIQSGEIPPFAKRITLTTTSPDDLELIVLKAESARLIIPELDFENPAGRGVKTKLYDYITECRENLQIYSAYNTTPQSVERWKEIFSTIELILSGDINFTVIIEDPLGLSFINSDKVVIEEELRSLSECEEWGLPFKSMQKCSRTDSIEEGANLIFSLLQKAKKVVGFTGAGVSVESGIPAFRTPSATDNIWDKYSPEDEVYSRWLESEEVRARHNKMKIELYPKFKAAKPNFSHHLFHELNKVGKLHTIITQNIDGLHEAAGVPIEKIIELHGNSSKSKCLTCQEIHTQEEIYEQFEKTGNYLPECKKCNGTLLKSQTVAFGESVPKIDLENSQKAIKDCDLLIIMGSSLLVSPANQLPEIAMKLNIPIILVNIGETKFDDYVTVHVAAKCGETMEKVLQLFKT